MRRRFLIALCAFLVLAGTALWAQSTVTPNVGFQIPAYNQANWQVPYNYNLTYLDTLLGGFGTLSVNSTTPSVSLYTNWQTANTSATAITNFVNGFPGQTLHIVCGDSNTTIAGSSNIIVNSSFVCSPNIAITFVLNGSAWMEIGRSTSSGAGTNVMNTWSASQYFPSGITIGLSGSPINSIVFGYGVLTYTAISAQTCQEQNLTVSGATAGIAAANPTATLSNVDLSWSTWLSAANTVTVRVCNPSSGTITPAAVAWNAIVSYGSSSQPPSPPPASVQYGPQIGSLGLDNIPIGCAPTLSTCASAADYRFLSTHTGTLDTALVYLILNSSSGYNAGTRGTVQAQIETDNGSGAPSGTVLGTATIVHPTYEVSPCTTSSICLLTFSPSPSLTANTVYHLVFTNTDSSPAVNYYSVDTLWWNNGLVPAQPKYSNLDWDTLYQSGSSWPEYLSSSGGHLTPILDLAFADSTNIGMGYMEVWSASGVGYTASGMTEVCETLTYSGSTTAFTHLAIAAAWTGGTDPITASVYSGGTGSSGSCSTGGTLLGTATFAASNFNSNGPVAGAPWPLSSLSSSVTLTNGDNYSLVITVPSTSKYGEWAVRKGVDYGFSTSTYYNDGHMQVSTNGGSSWTNVINESLSPSNEGDLMFYFAP